jgi:hypothetical protein
VTPDPMAHPNEVLPLAYRPSRLFQTWGWPPDLEGRSKVLCRSGKPDEPRPVPAVVAASIRGVIRAFDAIGDLADLQPATGLNCKELRELAGAETMMLTEAQASAFRRNGNNQP